MRAIFALATLWVLSLVTVFYATPESEGLLGVLYYLEDHGIFEFIRETVMLVASVIIVDMIHLPEISVKDLIFGTNGMNQISEPVRSAALRGYFTLQSAVVIGLALILYTT